MSDTPIYDEVVAKKAGDSFIEAMLDSYLSLKGEAGVLRRSLNKDPVLIQQYQVNELKSRRRYDYDYHRDFKREYGRKVYKSVVDWKV